MFDFRWNFLSRFSKLHSTCPEEFVEGKNSHRRKTVFLIFFRSLGGSFSAESSQLHSTCSEKQIEEKFFSWEKHYFFLLIFGLRAKSFLQSCKTASYISRAKFARKKYFFGEILVFGLFSKTFSDCQRIFLVGVVKPAFCVSSETFWRSWFLWERTRIWTKFFLHLKRESFWLLVKFSVKILKTAFYVSGRICWRKIFSSEKNSIFNFLSEFGRTFSAESSKLHSTCSDKQIEEKHFYWEKHCFFLLIFGLRAKSFLQSCKTASYISRAKFGRKKYFLVKF